MPAGVHVHCESSGAVLAPGRLAHPSRLSRGEAVLVGWDSSHLPRMKGWVTRDKLGSSSNMNMGVRVSPCTGQRGHGGWGEEEDGLTAQMLAVNSGYQPNCSCPSSGALRPCSLTHSPSHSSGS